MNVYLFNCFTTFISLGRCGSLFCVRMMLLMMMMIMLLGLGCCAAVAKSCYNSQRGKNYISIELSWARKLPDTEKSKLNQAKNFFLHTTPILIPSSRCFLTSIFFAGYIHARLRKLLKDSCLVNGNQVYAIHYKSCGFLSFSVVYWPISANRKKVKANPPFFHCSHYYFATIIYIYMDSWNKKNRKTKFSDAVYHTWLWPRSWWWWCTMDGEVKQLIIYGRESYSVFNCSHLSSLFPVFYASICTRAERWAFFFLAGLESVGDLNRFPFLNYYFTFFGKLFITVDVDDDDYDAVAISFFLNMSWKYSPARYTLAFGCGEGGMCRRKTFTQMFALPFHVNIIFFRGKCPSIYFLSCFYCLGPTQEINWFGREILNSNVAKYVHLAVCFLGTWYIILRKR